MPISAVKTGVRAPAPANPPATVAPLAHSHLDDAFDRENRDFISRRREGILNVVVYDDTNRPLPVDATEDFPPIIDFLSKMDPVTLTFWWRFGGLLNQMQLKADIVIPAKSWDEALDAIADRVADRQRQRRGEPQRIGSLQFWGHGTDGMAAMGNRGTTVLTESSYTSANSPIREKLARVRDLMHRSEGTVWFRCCEAFRRPRGKDFARASADFFGVPAVGHTFIIHALQSGCQVLRPGKTPDWPDDQGVPKRKNRAHVWSDPLRVKTVTALRFYPIEDAGWLGAKHLVNNVKALLNL